MYKVLLVDDEKIEREGISNLIEWNDYDINFIGAAKNGIEAYEIITEKLPDIVITDIKMPVMNGLELIEKVKANYANIVFIVLSGYGEYEYTSKAMLSGVKYYLLKPCQEDKIIEVLSNVKKEILVKEDENKALHSLEGNLKKILPHAKEQFFREAILYDSYKISDCDYYKNLFKIEKNKFKILTLKIDKQCEFIEKFALRNITEDIIQPDRVILSTIIEDNVILLIDSIEIDAIRILTEKLKALYIKHYQIDFHVALSEEGSFSDIHQMYLQTRVLLKYRFEYEDSTLLSTENLKNKHFNQDIDLSSDFESIALAVKKGDSKELNLGLKVFFAKIDAGKINTSDTKNKCLKLFRIIISHGQRELDNRYNEELKRFEKYNDADEMYKSLKFVADEITQMNYEISIKSKNTLVDMIIKCMYENINNPDLSLKWIAKDVLFMNEEYLGRVFYKTMNEKFSQYVLRIRMEMAKKLIENTQDIKTYEISRMTGFSEDAQYFCRLFKKHTGFTPSEYKKSLHQK